jgi:hemoglobin/transferrin/lactoferrin receptor protein
VRLQGTFTERWSRRDESAGELFQPPGNAVFDLFFTQRLGEKLTARAGLLNLTDRTYWRWTDVGGLSPSDPAIPFLAHAGRSVSLSLSMNWQ